MKGVGLLLAWRASISASSGEGVGEDMVSCVRPTFGGDEVCSDASLLMCATPVFSCEEIGYDFSTVALKSGYQMRRMDF